MPIVVRKQLLNHQSVVQVNFNSAVQIILVVAMTVLGLFCEWFSSCSFYFILVLYVIAAVESPNTAGVFGAGNGTDVVIWLVIMLIMIAIALSLQQMYLRKKRLAAAASSQEDVNDIEMAAKTGTPSYT